MKVKTQEELAPLVSADFCWDRRRPPALCSDWPGPSVHLLDAGNRPCHSQSPAEQEAGSGSCSRRHAGGRCSTPEDTCWWRPRSGRIPTSLSSTSVPEATTQQDRGVGRLMYNKTDEHKQKRSSCLSLMTPRT